MRDSKGNVKTNSAVEQTDAINKNDLENATKNLAKKSDVQNLTDSLNQVKEYIPQETSKENPLVNQNGLEEKLNGYASKGDKLVAMSELSFYTPLSNFNNLKALIPTEASTDNLLADRSWVISQIGTVYRYKGSVKNYSDLPTNADNGDVYNVENAYLQYPAGTNYAWNGTTWDALGGSIDLSNYVTQTSLTETLKDYATITYITQTLANYVTSTNLTNILSGYVTTTALNTKLNDYVTSVALTELLKSYTTTTAFNNHVNDKSNPHKVTKTQVGLGNVDNTSDKNKPVSTAQQTAIDNTGHELNIVGNEIQLLGANNQVLSRQTLPQTEIEYATDDEIRALFN